MPSPRHERLDLTSSSTPLLPVSMFGSFSEESVPGKLDEDDPVWKEYVDTARDFDNKMIDEWNKLLDVTLVFVSTSYYVLWHNDDVLQLGLFSAVLTSFIIESLKSIKPDAAELTNEILVLIFNKLSNSSFGTESLDLDKLALGKKDELWR
jgi:hypothetical protein